jgi:predicted nuclease of restriction endonuclease-like RecB superfamily
MTIRLPESGAAKLRQLLKYLRFNKLLCRISSIRDHEKSLLLEIDGPLSMFVNTQKYGFNLAICFSILHQPSWQLDAEVRMRKKPLSQFTTSIKLAGFARTITAIPVLMFREEIIC